MISVALTAFLLFFLQFIYNLNSHLNFEIPKVVLAEVIITLLVMLKILSPNKTIIRLVSKQNLVFISFFSFSLLASFFNSNPNSFFGNSFRGQGLLFFWYLLLFCWVSQTINLKNVSRNFYLFSLILLVFTTLVLGVNSSDRAIATLGEPNALAAVAIFIWPFVFLKGDKNWKVLAIISVLIILLLSGSRAGLVAFFIEIIFLSFAKWRIKIGLIISLILLGLSIILTFYFTFNEWENRAEIWQTAFLAGLNNPLLGGGFGNQQTLLHTQAVKLNNRLPGAVIDSSHNFLLDYWIELGIIGVGLIIFLIYQSFKNFVARKKLLEITTLLGVMTVMSFNPVSSITLLQFWWLLGQGSE